MTAPKVIYLPNELLSEDWERHIEGQDTEYVRRDTVQRMEYIIEQLKEMRKNQVAWFTLHDFTALNKSKDLEKYIDKLLADLETPNLFGV